MACDAAADLLEQRLATTPEVGPRGDWQEQQHIHDFGARHVVILEARDALEPERVEYLPGANARGISKATALLITAAESRSMVEWKHGMTHEEAETEVKMLSRRIADDLKVHRQQAQWVHRAGTDGYPGSRTLRHLKTLGRWNSHLQNQKEALLEDGSISYLMHCNFILCDHCDSCENGQGPSRNSEFRPCCMCFTHGRFGKLIGMVEKSAAAAVLALMQAEANRMMGRDLSFDELDSYAHWKMQHDEFPAIHTWNQRKHPHPHWTAAIRRFAPIPFSVKPLSLDLRPY